MMSRITWRAMPSFLAIGSLSCFSLLPGIDSSAVATEAAAEVGRGGPAVAMSQEDSVVLPNVLLVVVDDLGWKDVGFHEPTFSTPNLDAMVAEGVELSTFYTAPTCTPSRAQLMTGRYSYRTGMQDSVLHSTEPRGVPLSESFVGEKLQSVGYGTAAVGKWHLGMHMPQYLPVERGFDDFYGILTGGGGHYSHISVSQGFSPRGGVGHTRSFSGPNLVEGDEPSVDNQETTKHSTELYTQKAAQFLEAMSAEDDPWFLYLSYQAIHDPIETDESWISGRPCEFISAENSSSGENDETDYANRKITCGMVAQMDNGLGTLRGQLERLGEWDNTVVIFLSDNGGLASHGSVNRPFRGGKGDYWEGGVHVPAFVSGGFVSAALKRNGLEPYRYGHLTHVTDVHATVLGLSGFSPGIDDVELDGFDLWESLVQTQAPVRDAVVINLNSPNFASSGAVRWSKYKLIRNPEPKESVIYSKVQSKLVDEAMVVPESIMAEVITSVHEQIHVAEAKMYLFDLEENPSESVVEGCGTGRHGAGPVRSCANLYDIPAFRDIRRKLEGMLLKAEEESAPSTMRWQDDGPLADPETFGGWIPWRDSEGYPLAAYGGVGVENETTGQEGQSPDLPEAQQRISLADLGSRGTQGSEGLSISLLAVFFALIAVGSTFAAYRAGQRSGYRVLSV